MFRLVCAVLLAVTVAPMPVRPAAAADSLTVLLDWSVNPNHGPLIVAQEIGAFRRAGLDVHFVQPADPTMPPRLIAAGHGDIALDYQAQLCQQVANGLPLMRIGVVIDTLRNRIERCINRLKNRRRVATRYDHTASSFLGFVQLAAIRLWIGFVHAA